MVRRRWATAFPLPGSTILQSWDLEQEALENEENYWPIQALKFLARFPHEYETWLGFGHTIPNGDPAAPFAGNTKLCGVLLACPITLPEEAQVIPTSKGPVNLYSLLPLYEQEMRFKLSKGTEALLDKFDEHQISEHLIPDRKPVVRRKLFRLF